MSGWESPAVVAGAVVLVAGPAAAVGAQEAIVLAGAQVAGVSDWPMDQSAIESTPFGSVVLIEAEGVTPDLLEDGLRRLAPSDRGLRMVVTLDESRIDLVAALLLDTDAALLVYPSQADRVVALIAASRGSARLRETDGDRLARLNEEIARIAAMLARLSDETSDPVPAAVADSSSRYRARPGGTAVDAQIVRRAIRARRMRDAFFPPALFEDPAWDMLLDLFAAELEGGEVSVSSLCIAAAVAPTTALRWIGRMTANGLLSRKPDPGDRRRAFVVLTAEASNGMRGYAAALARAELAFV